MPADRKRCPADSRQRQDSLAPFFAPYLSQCRYPGLADCLFSFLIVEAVSLPFGHGFLQPLSGEEPSMANDDILRRQTVMHLARPVFGVVAETEMLAAARERVTA